MKKLLSVTLGAVLVPAIAFSNVSALGRGQFPEGNFYYSPQNNVAADPVNATCNNELTLKVRAHNAGPSAVENTTVRVSLPTSATTSQVSTATISSPYADPNSVTDTMTVNLDKAGKLNYVAGSAELLDAGNTRVSGLPDTLTTTGVNIGEVKVSEQEIRFVQFKVKVACETPVTPVTPTTPTTPKTQGTQAPAVIAATGPASAIATMFGLSSLAAGATYFVRSRRNILG